MLDSSYDPISPQTRAIGRARLWLLAFSPADLPDEIEVIRALVRLRDSTIGVVSATCASHLRSIARA